MHDKDIIFELDNKTIGLVESNCSGFNIVKNAIYVEDIDVIVKSKYEKECDNRIQTYIYAIIFVIIFAVIVIILLVYGIYKLKNNENFFWMRLNDNRIFK
jgi:hypothetical protein